MGATSIEWTEKTWNPLRGCSLVSPGCTNCYAMKQAHRYAGEGKPFAGLTRKRDKGGPVWTGEVRFVEHMLELPLTWRQPQRVFVNSMSDLFHDDVSNEDIAAVFGVMAACQQHTFQVLTKRAERMRKWFEWVQSWRQDRWSASCLHEAERRVGRAISPGIAGVPLRNVWLGVSVEDQQRADERIPHLLATPAAVRFISYEPALGPVDFSRANVLWSGVRLADGSRWTGDGGKIDWIIVGGESGPGARPFDLAWARSTIEQCKAAGVACFVKQLGRYPQHNPPEWGAYCRPDGIRDEKGGDWSQWPEDLRVREWPTNSAELVRGASDG